MFCIDPHQDSDVFLLWTPLRVPVDFGRTFSFHCFVGGKGHFFTWDDAAGGTAADAEREKKDSKQIKLPQTTGTRRYNWYEFGQNRHDADDDPGTSEKDE